MAKRKKDQKKKRCEFKVFTVPFDSKGIKEDCIDINIPTKPHKEEMIDQAIKYHQEGNFKEALKYYQFLIKQGLEDHRVYSNYGIILKRIGKSKEAELLQRKAIKIKPNDESPHFNLGVILKDQGKLKEAEKCYRKAIEINPIHADAHYNLGIIFNDLGQLDEAVNSYRKAIELKPNFAIAHSNLGIVLKDLGQLNEAVNCYRKAIEISPSFTDAYFNLGNTLRDLGQLNEAKKFYLKAIEINPNFKDAYFNLSLIELQKGDYQSGLENYEYRLTKKNPIIPCARVKIKRIENRKLQNLDKILVISEQGLGDTIQYMRYIKYLKKLGLNISFCAQTKLHSLIQSSGIDSQPLHPEECINIEKGEWISLLSLPKYLKINPKNDRVPFPYIFSKDSLNKKWKNILSKEKRPIIGINWQGNPDVEIHTQKGRSLPLETFSKISSGIELTMLSLQKGFGSDQLDHCSFKNKFVKSQAQINSTWDFLENAAIIENCDLIITSDTSIAHLAGGMNKMTWLLLKYLPEWRWGLEGESTFWYPSMRLFRQKETNNWNEVMERVLSALKKEIGVKK